VSEPVGGDLRERASVRATFTDTQDALRDALRDLLADHAGSARVRSVVFDGDGVDADLWSLLVEMGVTDLPGMIDQGIVAEHLGGVAAPVPYVEHLVATAALAAVAPDHELMTRFVSGDAVAVYAAGETARLEDGHVHGRLSGVPHAAVATHLLVEAHDGQQRVLAVIDAGSTKREALPTMDRTRPLAQVVIDGAPATFVTRADASALDPVSHVAAALYAHDLLGVAQTCLDLGVEHARTRSQFGKAIGTYQAVSHRLVDMYVALESARSHAYHAAWAVSAGESVAPLAAHQAKAAASDAAVLCAQDAIQVHGGIGFTWEHDLHLYLKRARSGSVLWDTASQHRRWIADLITA
jgi:alkylation response protein AidB-like acyl-CoA dehydrogenase